MAKLISNSDGKDSVRAAFDRLTRTSRDLCLAAPYFTYPDPVLSALNQGATVRLLIGLNSATHPDALSAILGRPRLSVRYYTSRFHAKLYVFDEDALVGSANLTEAGLQGNREVVAWFTASDEGNEVESARGIFEMLWEGAQPLSSGGLLTFRNAWMAARGTGPDPDAQIAAAVGIAVPPTISVERSIFTAAQLASARLRTQIEEEYRPAFAEVTKLLIDEQLERVDVADLAPAFRTNRFLNWVRLTHAPGESWKEIAPCSELERRDRIVTFGREWQLSADGRVETGYAEGIQGVLAPFANPATLALASREEITTGLLGIHAFEEQRRFTDGGRGSLPARFWSENNNDVERVRTTLGFLLHGPGDFVSRLHAVLYNPQRKVAVFGKFCSLELCGTVKPEECPPVNGRSAKALRFLGFKVTAS